MAGPVVTTLLSPNPASGTWAPTDNVTETTLASATAASGVFTLEFDQNTQADGDEIILTVYGSPDGSNYRILDQIPLGPNAPGTSGSTGKMFELGPYPAADHIKFTALLSAGSTTSRSFAWRVFNLVGA